MSTPSLSPHPAWLPRATFDTLRSHTVAVLGQGTCLDTVREELADARATDAARASLVIARADESLTAPALGISTLPVPPEDGFATLRTEGRIVIVAATDAAALYGLFALAREEATARLTGEAPPDGVNSSAPGVPLRMLDHWDNVAVHPWMGQVERGYSGGSIFYDHGEVRSDLGRVREYARLIASCGVNAVAINNVNVHERAARLLTTDLDDVTRIAACFRPYGIRVFLSVSFGSPMLLGGLDTNDPLDPRVAEWWARAAADVWTAVPDFGGFLVKADSEGQPGPFAYGRTHADGANMLAAAVAPHDGIVFWRAFVYNHAQDWRDRTTDRARAAYDHFAPLDGEFADNVVLQIKHGPMDFQVREPVSPVFAAMPHTRLALELQITQEYTGQQKHVCYLAPAWRQYLRFPLDGHRALCETLTGRAGAIVGVSNVGDDVFWTGHPMAQANLYAFARLAWDPQLAATEVLDEWIALTFAAASDSNLARIRATLHTMMDGSWQRYERYTAPLGVGFMVSTVDRHYGPGVDAYEYSKWGTYHFADRDGVGVDRTVASGTGFTGQYPEPWRSRYESLENCPDELLLFFHHVPYGHRLHSGQTVIQHIYDSRYDAVEELADVEAAWTSLANLVGTPGLDAAWDERVRERLAEQRRNAIEWRDQVRSYFFRKSGVPDASGHTIY